MADHVANSPMIFNSSVLIHFPLIPLFSLSSKVIEQGINLPSEAFFLC